ncbi:MAG: plasmid stabilization protein [Alphaproteobacteria bacterium]
MTDLRIHNLDYVLKRHRSIRAARNGRSLEDEARNLLRIAMDEDVRTLPFCAEQTVPRDVHRQISRCHMA